MASLIEARKFYKNNTIDVGIESFISQGQDWILIYLYNNFNLLILNTFIIHLIKLNKKKVLEDFIFYINKHQFIDKLYKKKILGNEIYISYKLLQNLIFIGVRVNSDLLDIKLNDDINNYINYLINSIKELEKINYKTYFNNSILNNLKDELKWEKEKIESYNLIRDAYYAQKINRFIKYYYDDKYRLSPFRLKLEEKRYLNLFKK